MKKNGWIWRCYARVRSISQMVSDDRITLYAAQASFYIMISAVPFVSVLLAILSLVIPVDVSGLVKDYALPAQFQPILDKLLQDIQIVTVPTVSLLSISALTTLWSASRGMAALRTGMESVYHARSRHGYLLERIRSLFNTLVFIALIVLAVGLLLFGNFIIGLIHNLQITDMLQRLRWPFLVFVMCVAFLAVYATTARRSEKISNRLMAHLPGALFATLGWIVFSIFYALYIEFFPNAGHIYGSLAAICLMMLWLYFCLIILLMGAEINKLCFLWRNKQFEGKTA